MTDFIFLDIGNPTIQVSTQIPVDQAPIIGDFTFYNNVKYKVSKREFTLALQSPSFLGYNLVLIVYADKI